MQRTFEFTTVIWVTSSVLLLFLLYSHDCAVASIDPSTHLHQHDHRQGRAKSISPAAARSSHNPCADIRNGQFICLDCSTLAFCVQEGGNWLTLEYETCSTAKSLYCDAELLGCTYQRKCNQPRRGIKFECQNPGIYPDPHDCTQYHKCNELNEDTRIVCPSGRAFSIADKDCTLMAKKNDVCTKPQYECNNFGDIAAWPMDENIYYICYVRSVNGNSQLFPLLYRCASGEKFNGERCVAASNGDRGNDNNSERSGNDNGNGNSNGKSNQSGCINGRLLPYERNCRSYYVCQNGNKALQQCPFNTIFNAKTESCEIGKCV